MTIRKLAPIALVGLVAALGLTGCTTNTQGDDASPVFLTVNFQLLPLQKNVASGTPLQIQTTILQSRLKVPNAASTQFLDTQIEDYEVVWERIDGGRTAPGREVWGGNVTVPANGTSTLNNYPVMSATALSRPPLDKLFPFNGGVDPETRSQEIRCKATVTFRGRTLSGQPVAGTGNMDMIFIYSALAGRVVGTAE